jgi:hypothetical protein
MRFGIKIDSVVEADNIDDLFLKLASHFQYLEDNSLEDPQIFDSGELSIKKIEGED